MVTKPSWITFTGVDETYLTNPQVLRVLATTFHTKLELGILYHSNKEGPRYPSADWFKSLFFYPDLLRRCSLHLCGKESIQAFLKGEGFETELSRYFRRVQLNTDLTLWDKKDLIKALCRDKSFNRTIVFQDNAANKEILSELVYIFSDLHVLFDSSGGKGIAPDSWPQHHEQAFCGFAGGISPDNVLDVVNDLGSRGKPYYLDMETSLRNHKDEFSFAKVFQVLESVF